METGRVGDRNVVRFNSGSISSLLLLAFLGDLSWLVTVVAAVMLAGTVSSQAGLFKQIYWRMVRPRRWLAPSHTKGRVEGFLGVEDDPAAHQFAQALGGIVLVLSSLLFLAGIPSAGWTLAWVVIVLAGLNVLDVCVGCFIYYQLALRGIHIPMPT